ncbi:hypothetical protein [Microbacterium sp. 179-I 3D3 NHS]|uniref:hypothetical protein n=1 Tax=unclassified Microbacterium TaxID=2609290 RepID=UPI00399F7DB9
MRSSRFRIGVLGAAAALLMGGALLPLGAAAATPSAEAEAEVELSSSSPESLLWDPGPRHRCWSVVEERPQGTPLTNLHAETSGCDEIDALAVQLGMDRHDTNAACWPAGKAWVGVQGQTCPAWRFNTHGWLWGDSGGKTPGFDHWVEGADGSPLTLTLVNNAHNLGGTNPCRLTEVTATYEYLKAGLKRHPKLSEGLVFTGNLKVPSAPSASSCGEDRKILTTDIMWTSSATGADKVHLIQVVNFNPNGWDIASNDPRVLWDNKCEGGHCRISVADPSGYMSVGQDKQVSIDFTQLFETYKSYFAASGITAANSDVRAVQVVNSTVGANLTAQVRSMDFTAGG